MFGIQNRRQQHIKDLRQRPPLMLGGQMQTLVSHAAIPALPPEPTEVLFRLCLKQPQLLLVLLGRLNRQSG